MTRRVRFSLLLLLACGPSLGVAPMTIAAAQEAPEMPFDEAQLFFELNDTDGDLGIHASIDGGPWIRLTIEGPGDRRLLEIVSRGMLRDQALTQLAFESAEPSFEDLDPADFFRRFPQGWYDIEGIAQNGQKLESTTFLSHVLAAPPGNITLSGKPISEDCESDVPVVSTPLVVDWDPVTSSHPEIGRSGAVRIVRYQLFVESAGRVAFSVDLPPSITRFTVPTGVTNLAREFKVEIIARTSRGNNTAVESCFRRN